MPYDYEGGRKRKIPLAEALQRAAPIVKALAGDGLPTTICGSIRRQVAEVGDIDLAIVGDFESVVGAIRKNFEIVQITKDEKVPGKKPRTGFTFVHEGYQVNCYCCSQETQGSMILFLTGSKEFNIRCRYLAKVKGMTLNQYGLWKAKTKKLVASRTEEEMFKALGQRYVDPTGR